MNNYKNVEKLLFVGFVDGDLPYPMLVSDCTDTENMQMINFAARHNAKIVQRAKDDVKGMLNIFVLLCNIVCALLSNSL